VEGAFNVEGLPGPKEDLPAPTLEQINKGLDTATATTRNDDVEG
jgi:hypothetical protein